MKRFFKGIVMVGGGMILVGILITVISLACGAEFGSLTFNSGVFGYLPFKIKNAITEEVMDISDDWYHHHTTNSIILQNGDQNTQQGSPVQKVKLVAKGCTVQIVAGDSSQTSAVLEISGKMTQDHVRQKLDNDGDLELTIDTNQNILPIEADEYQAVLTVPPALIQLEIEAAAAEVTAKSMAVTELDIEADAADVKLTNVSAAKSDLKAQAGNITGTAQLSGKNDMECSMGNIELTVSGVVDYGYVIENSMGNVSIGGHEHSGVHNKVELNKTASTVFDVECSMGNVEVDFR